MVSAVSECKTQGFMCREKCTELVRCTKSGNDTFTEQVVRRCDGTIGKLCKTSTLDCSEYSCKDDELDNNVKITCYEDGFFPHPVRCNQYYSCNHSILLEFVCPKNEVFNAKQNNCTSPSTAYACVTPIPRCEKITDVGAYSENPAVYFVCAYDQFGYLRPELHRCDNGFVFDNEAHACVVPSSGSLISINLALLTLIACLNFLWTWGSLSTYVVQIYISSKFVHLVN